MKKFLCLLSVVSFPFSVLLAGGPAPVENIDISGTSKISAGTFNIQSGVVFTALSGSTIDLSAGTLTFASNQISWASVNKSGSRHQLRPGRGSIWRHWRQ